MASTEWLHVAFCGDCGEPLGAGHTLSIASHRASQHPHACSAAPRFGIIVREFVDVETHAQLMRGDS